MKSELWTILEVIACLTYGKQVPYQGDPTILPPLPTCKVFKFNRLWISVHGQPLLQTYWRVPIYFHELAISSPPAYFASKSILVIIFDPYPHNTSLKLDADCVPWPLVLRNLTKLSVALGY